VRLRIHVEATAELDAAAAWYDHERQGLGDELVDEVSRALAVISASPTTWPIVRRATGLRRFLLSRFPYTIIYAVVERDIRVFAFAHHKRRPGYWRKRRFQ
jgi:toxin ParE1/3/4